MRAARQSHDPSSRRHLGLFERQEVADQLHPIRTCHDDLAARSSTRRNRNDDVARSGVVLFHEVPAVSRHDRLRHDGPRIVKMDQMPGLARLPRADIGKIGSRALRAEHRRVLERVVLGTRWAAERTIHRQVAHELRMTESAPLAQVNFSSSLLLVPSGPDGGRGRQRLFAQSRQHRDHEGQHEEHNGGHRDDGPMVRMQPTEAHDEICTTSGEGGGAMTGRGRLAQTFTANTMWLPTIKRPPIVRQSHIGSAAITEAMNDCPDTHAKPWRTPATEIEITYVRTPTSASQK